MTLMTLHLLLLVVGTAFTAQALPERQTSGDVAARLGCGAVNFLVTAFLPQPHATAFCSAYLQIPTQQRTSTATVTASASTVTKTESRVVPTLMRTVTQTTTSATTTTIDQWIGKPACTAVPTFGWIQARQKPESNNLMIGLEQACGCLEIPMATEILAVTETITPTVTVTEGITASTEVVATETRVAVETRTKMIFLVDRPNNASGVKEKTARRNQSLTVSMTERNFQSERNQSAEVGGFDHVVVMPIHKVSWP